MSQNPFLPSGSNQQKNSSNLLKTSLFDSQSIVNNKNPFPVISPFETSKDTKNVSDSTNLSKDNPFVMAGGPQTQLNFDNLFKRIAEKEKGKTENKAENQNETFFADLQKNPGIWKTKSENEKPKETSLFGDNFNLGIPVNPYTKNENQQIINFGNKGAFGAKPQNTEQNQPNLFFGGPIQRDLSIGLPKTSFENKGLGLVNPFPPSSKPDKEDEKKLSLPRQSFWDEEEVKNNRPSKLKETTESVSFFGGIPLQKPLNIQKNQEFNFSIKPRQEENKEDNIIPILQTLKIPPLRYEYDLTRPDREVEMISDQELFSNLPIVIENTKKELEKLREFRSKPLVGVSVNWLKEHKITKNKALFEQFIEKIDELPINYDDKQSFLEKLQEIFLFHEQEILTDPVQTRDMNLFYSEQLEKTLIYREDHENNDDLEEKLLKVKAEIKLKEQELETNKKNVPVIDINKNEVVEKLSKEAPGQKKKNEKEQEKLALLQGELKKKQKHLEKIEKEIIELKAKIASQPLFAMISAIIREIEDKNREMVEPLLSKYAFLRFFEGKMQKNLNESEEKSRHSSELIINYHKVLDENKEELTNFKERARMINEQKLRLEEQKKTVDLQFEAKKDIWNKLNQENLVLSEKHRNLIEEKQEKNKKLQEEKKASSEEIIKEYKLKKTRNERLKEEIALFGISDEIDDLTLNKLKDDVDELRSKIIEIEAKKKEFSRKKKEIVVKPFSPIIFLWLFLLLCAIIGFLFFDTWKQIYKDPSQFGISF